MKNIFNFVSKKTKKLILMYNCLFLCVIYNISIYKLVVIDNEKLSFFLLGLFIFELLFVVDYIKNIKKLNRVEKFNLISEEQLERLHDSQNEIMVLRSLLETKRIMIKKLDDECSKISSKAIKNIIIQKINQTRFSQIDYDIKISTYSYNEINLMLEKSVCKMVNIFLDNAIESCQNSGRKIIAISIFEGYKKIEIGIANYLTKPVDLNLISVKGFSTKGNKRGFGLFEASKIVSNNVKISNQTKIVGDVFLQIIEVEI